MLVRLERMGGISIPNNGDKKMPLTLRSLVVGMAIFAGLVTPGRTANALLIHESATLGQTGLTTGFTIDFAQFLGSRFSVDSTVDVTDVGGHINALIQFLCLHQEKQNQIFANPL